MYELNVAMEVYKFMPLYIDSDFETFKDKNVIKKASQEYVKMW